MSRTSAPPRRDLYEIEAEKQTTTADPEKSAETELGGTEEWAP